MHGGLDAFSYAPLLIRAGDIEAAPTRLQTGKVDAAMHHRLARGTDALKVSSGRRQVA